MTEPRPVVIDGEKLDRLLMGVRSVLDRRAMSSLQATRRDALMAAVVFHEHGRDADEAAVLASAEVFLDWLRAEGIE